MKVDIWSDVRCPFCYIGKHKFEKALGKFPQKDNIEVVWHSFELDPYIKTDPDKSIYDHLAENKGISGEQAEQMVAYSTKIAKEAGLKFNQEKSVVANSLNAHRLIQYAKTKGLGNEAEEQLFKAYFEEEKNIDNSAELIKIGTSIGLDKKGLENILSSDIFKKEVREDESMAQQIG
ncbi:MAG: DsbA family oxidoreductase, partial [Chitinophagaceae bacterium]